MANPVYEEYYNTVVGYCKLHKKELAVRIVLKKKCNKGDYRKCYRGRLGNCKYYKRISRFPNWDEIRQRCGL